MTIKMITDDGWSVEVVKVEVGGHAYQVKYSGFLMGGNPSFKTMGLVRTVAEVKKIMGDEAFKRLHDDGEDDSRPARRRAANRAARERGW